MEASELATLLHEYANIIRPFDWILQIYIALDAVEGLEDIIPSLGVKVCIDDFGSPSLPKLGSEFFNTDPYTLPVSVHLSTF
jgi:hypothetical protein